MPTMSELIAAIPQVGFAVVVGAALIYVVLHGEFEFRYPRGPKGRRRD